MLENGQLLFSFLRSFSNREFVVTELFCEILLVIAVINSLFGLFAATYAHKETHYLTMPLYFSVVFHYSFLIYIPFYYVIEPLLEAIFSYESDFSSTNHNTLTYVYIVRLVANVLLSLTSIAAVVFTVRTFSLINNALRQPNSFLSDCFAYSAPFTIIIGGIMFFLECCYCKQITSKIKPGSVFVTFFKLYPSITKNYLLPTFIVPFVAFIIAMVPLLFISLVKGERRPFLSLLNIYLLLIAFTVFLILMSYCYIKCLIYDGTTPLPQSMQSFRHHLTSLISKFSFTHSFVPFRQASFDGSTEKLTSLDISIDSLLFLLSLLIIVDLDL